MKERRGVAVGEIVKADNGTPMEIRGLEIIPRP